MSKTRMIKTKFWDDNYIIELDPIEKLLFLYFLTNSMTNICGIYEIPLRRIAFDTGIDKDMVDKVLKRFTGDNKIYYIDGWIYIKNFEKHQRMSGSIEIGIKKGLEEIPTEIMAKIKEIDTHTPHTPPTHPPHTDISKLESKLKLESKPKSKPEAKVLVNHNSEDIRLTKLLYQQVKENYSFLLERKTEKQWESDYAEMSRIHRIDSRDYKVIEFVINWSQKNDFWRKNIRSVNKLRKQFSNLMVQAYEDNKKNKTIVV